MKSKIWIGLFLFGLLLLGSSALVHPGEAATANIYFQDQTASKGTIIYADNQSFVNNLTSLAYIDDLATRRVLSNTSKTWLSWHGTTWVNLDYPLSPMDSGGFNASGFTFSIRTTEPAPIIVFHFEIRLMHNSTLFNRSFTVTGNGTYNIPTGAEMCKYCTRYRLVSYTAALRCSMRIWVTQSRWGVIEKLDKTFYVRNAGFDLYSGFGVSGKQVSINDNIVFNESSTFDYDIFNIGGQNSISFKNCSIYVNDRSNLFSKSQYIIANGINDSFTNTYFYSSKPNNINVFFNTNLNITSGLFYGVSIFGGRFVHVNDSVFTNYGSSVGSFYFKVFTASSFKDVTFKNSRYGFYGFASALSNYTGSNLVFKNIQFIMYPQGATNKVYLVNCTSNSWAIDDSYAFGQFVDPGKLVRSYTFELRVMNGSSPLSSVNIKVYDKAGVLRYSGSSDAQGRIPKQTFMYSIWNASHQVTPYIYSPYILNLTKPGYRSLNYAFNNSVRLNLTIGMARNVTTVCNSTELSLYENLVNASGTHQSSYSPVTGWRVWANITGNTTPVFLFQNFVNATGTHVKQLRGPGWYVWANVTGNASTGPGTGNYTVMLNFTGLDGYIDWTGDVVENNTNISFPVSSDMSLNGSVHVNGDAYFLAGMLSLDPAAMILSLFFGFFYIGYKSDKRSGGWFMLFAGFLLIALGVLIYGILGYAAALVTPFAIFIMILGIKKGLYGPETVEDKNTSTK